jgi:hypothetical protein
VQDIDSCEVIPATDLSLTNLKRNFDRLRRKSNPRVKPPLHKQYPQVDPEKHYEIALCK